ncbi:ABC transporter ATP-binding protein [Marinoscillum furvescens]|uniref:ABC-type multidrug transport system fused ATPase/permease subunit n=1 Tax=Marinoscillum furvescens DSM 4134 TaxID=1122208 RepID=A0A3D9L2F4_MARFU|nr:ABC transporter ATP-binding protein [Marinoscillum furvescens]RED98919.1 ABC-type multidrug transport system fused ATPase/permease subunit [Marinoscillum furvescens DSM 4134]
MRVFLRILSFARPLGGTIPLYLGLIIPATIFSVVNLSVLIPLLQVLFDQAQEVEVGVSTSGWSIQNLKSSFYGYLHEVIQARGKLSALYLICTIAVVSVLLANCFRYFSQLVLASVRVRVMKNLRNEAYSHILYQELGFFTHRRKGDLVARVTTDIQEIEQSAVSTLKAVIKEPFLIIGYLIVLIAISPKLTLYTLLLLPVAGVGVSLVARRIRKWARRSQESMGQIGHLLDETIMGIRTIKAFMAETFQQARFEQQVKAYSDQAFQIAARSNLAAPLSEVIGVSVLVLVLVIGGREVLVVGQLAPAEFIGFLIIFSQLLNPAKAISVAVSQISRGLSAADRVFELMDHRSILFRSEKKELHLENELIFDQVSFDFDGEAVLSEVSFGIKKGETIALVGPSGAGKSTVADLLCGFYQPKMGQVLIDGEPLNLYNHQWLEQIAYVGQEPVVFHDTIAANILFANPSATDEELEHAARGAYLHEFIMSLPNCYQTTVGDRGTRLSGGERQRLTIARAILKNPKVLVLDEATSALDAQSEQLVQEAVSNLMKNRTSLVIAHRLSTIQHADRILVMDKGRIVEQGNHEELLEQKGLYHKLARLQAFS